MIVAERKPFDEILEIISPYKKILVLGCGGCVSVCLTGGEKNAEELASELRLASGQKKLGLTVEFDSITRQCDREFIDNLTEEPKKYDCVLTLACGVGVGYMTELYPDVPFLPAMNTTFYGANTAPGTWAEYCRGCGDCVLALTGGICPIARCSKSMINGPCGGTKEGKCEVSPDMDCAWQLIYDKLTKTGKIKEFLKIRPPRDHRKDRGNGVRTMTLREMAQQEQE